MNRFFIKTVAFLFFFLSVSLSGQELLKNFNFLNYKQNQVNLDQLNEIWLQSKDLNNDDLQGLAKRANEKIGYGYYSEALADLEKAILIDSTIAYLYNLRAICYINLKNTGKAEESFRLASNLDSSDAVSNYYLSVFLIDRESYDSAEKLLKNYDRDFPDNYLINYGLANLYLTQLKPDKAIRFYKRSAELNPEFPDAWYNIGIINLYTYDFFNAARFFEKTIKYNPNYAPAWFMKGFLLLNQGKLDKTLEYWNQAVSLDSANEYYKISRGILKIYMKDYNNGFAEINSIMKDSSNFNFFRDFSSNRQDRNQFNFKEQLHYFNLHSEGLQKGLKVALQEYLCKFLISDYDGALAILKKSSIMFNTNSLIDFYQGIINEYFREWQKSGEYYQKSLKELPLIEANYLHYAIILQRFNKYSESVSFLNKFLEYDSSSVIVYRYRGIAYMSINDYGSALNDFDKYFSIDSFDLDLTYNKAMCYKQLGQYNLAVAQFDTILTYRAYDDESRFYRSECLLTMGETDSCLSSISKIGEYYFSINPDVYFLRGKANLLQKRYNEALFDFNNYIEKKPLSIDCLYYISRIYRINKDYPKLFDTYTKMLNIDSELPEIYYLRAMTRVQIKNDNEVCKDLKVAYKKGYAQAEYAIQVYCVEKD